MPKISISHDRSLEIAHNKLRVRRSLKGGTSLDVLADGLYAEQKSGSGSGGYPDRYRSPQGGLTSGIDYPYKDEYTNPYNKRLVSPSITHRVFTCESDDGSDIYIRDCDKIFPGDLYRVLDSTNNVYKYYLITKTTGTDVTGHSGVVANIPVNATCN